MKETILIAGSGRMALSIGDCFLDRGHPVTWVTESREQHQRLLQKIERKRSRLRKYLAQDGADYRADCRLLGEEELADADIVIESTVEVLAKKQRMISLIMEGLGKTALVCSNSSSFLPQSIHSDCIGTHFFYPVALTPCVELIVPGQLKTALSSRIMQFFRTNDFAVVVEDQRSAFLANRLLLPLQSRCFAALRQGYPPTLVDAASISKILPLGQLSLMDTIGLDIIHAAVEQYRHFEDLGPVDFDLLQSSLAALIALDKRGKKNNNGLLVGEALPWISPIAGDLHKDHGRLQEALLQSCLQALDKGLIACDQLRLICERIYHCDSFTEVFDVSCKEEKTVQL